MKYKASDGVELYVEKAREEAPCVFRFPRAEVQVMEGAHHPYIENRHAFQQAIAGFVKYQENNRTSIAK